MLIAGADIRCTYDICRAIVLGDLYAKMKWRHKPIGKTYLPRQEVANAGSRKMAGKVKLALMPTHNMAIIGMVRMGTARIN